MIASSWARLRNIVSSNYDLVDGMHSRAHDNFDALWKNSCVT